MKPRLIHVWLTAVFFLSTSSGGLRAETIRWPEAVSRLASEKTMAVTCVALLKGHGDQTQVSHGRLTYSGSKAHFDAVIAGLLTALGEGGTPEGLSNFEAELNRGTSGLSEFCKDVDHLLPSNVGQKGPVLEIVKEAIEPVLKPLSDAVSTLYHDYRKDKADNLTRLTIQTQLEAARWPDFDEVKPTQ